MNNRGILYIIKNKNAIFVILAIVSLMFSALFLIGSLNNENHEESDIQGQWEIVQNDMYDVDGKYTNYTVGSGIKPDLNLTITYCKDGIFVGNLSEKNITGSFRSHTLSFITDDGDKKTYNVGTLCDNGLYISTVTYSSDGIDCQTSLYTKNGKMPAFITSYNDLTNNWKVDSLLVNGNYVNTKSTMFVSNEDSSLFRGTLNIDGNSTYICGASIKNTCGNLMSGISIDENGDFWAVMSKKGMFVLEKITTSSGDDALITMTRNGGTIIDYVPTKIGNTEWKCTDSYNLSGPLESGQILKFGEQNRYRITAELDGISIIGYWCMSSTPNTLINQSMSFFEMSDGCLAILTYSENQLSLTVLSDNDATTMIFEKYNGGE